MRVTIKDIAIRSNLSHTTVSRVLNRRGDAFISESTRQRIITLAREMGYQPNTIARALVTGRSNTIALAISAVVHPLAAEAIYYLMNEAKAHQYEMVVTNIADDRDAPLTQLPVDGFLFFNSTLPEGYESGRIDKPIVTIGTGCPREFDHVEVDLFEGAVHAMRHLIERPCKRVAFLSMAELTVPGDPRTDAYKQTMAAAGLPEEHILQPHSSLPNVQSADAFTTVLQYVEEHGFPEAIFCRNDQMALGAYRALRSHGCRVPEDVALVGCDGIDAAKYLDSPLTTIQQPIEEMCKLGWQFLKRRMDDPSLPLQATVLQSKLNIRRSSLK